jgi:putative SOS response-associated peptidase YedK
MCGRFALSLSPAELKLVFDLLQVPSDVVPRYNIAPTQDVLMVTADDRRAAAWARWGLIPSWARDPKIGAKAINARAETVAEKPTFRAALRRRRCLVLADGFYEWKRRGGKKTPMFIRRRSREAFAFAGLWETWGEITSCTIITTSANALVAPIHDRMPVILARDAHDEWLDRGTRELLRPCSSEDLEAFPVSTLVNSVANDVPACIEPVEIDGW